MPILRSAFIALSRNQPIRQFAESSSLGRRMSSRFVAGMEIEDVLDAAQVSQDAEVRLAFFTEGLDDAIVAQSVRLVGLESCH